MRGETRKGIQREQTTAGEEEGRDAHVVNPVGRNPVEALEAEQRAKEREEGQAEILAYHWARTEGRSVSEREVRAMCKSRRRGGGDASSPAWEGRW